MNALTLLLSLLAPAAHAADAPSVHGMLFFGHEKVYVSHLPMFHSPHDYQLIAELEVPPAALQAYAKAQKERPEETVYTLVPERFSLPLMVASPKPFHADLYSGHFERGGTPIAEGITVKLGKVLHFRKFQPGAAQPVDSSYLLFGSAREAFLAHLITAKPDFDQILPVHGATVADGATLVTLPGHANATPLAPGVAELTTADGTEIPLTLQPELYLEHGDLAH